MWETPAIWATRRCKVERETPPNTKVPELWVKTSSRKWTFQPQPSQLTPRRWETNYQMKFSEFLTHRVVCQRSHYILVSLLYSKRSLEHVLSFNSRVNFRWKKRTEQVSIVDLRRHWHERSTAWKGRGVCIVPHWETVDFSKNLDSQRRVAWRMMLPLSNSRYGHVRPPTQSPQKTFLRIVLCCSLYRSGNWARERETGCQIRELEWLCWSSCGLGSSLHKVAAGYHSKLFLNDDSETRGGNWASSLWAETALIPGDHLGKG